VSSIWGLGQGDYFMRIKLVDNATGNTVKVHQVLFKFIILMITTLNPVLILGYYLVDLIGFVRSKEKRTFTDRLLKMRTISLTRN